MSIRIALAGDTMLGRGAAEQIERQGTAGLFSPGVRDLFTSADLSVVNLECCISSRGHPFGGGKVFHFRAPPQAAAALADLGVDCVNLANNHALDYGFAALADTRDYLATVGIVAVGAGRNLVAAREPVVLTAGGLRVGLTGVTDHPADYPRTGDSCPGGRAAAQDGGSGSGGRDVGACRARYRRAGDVRSRRLHRRLRDRSGSAQ